MRETLLALNLKVLIEINLICDLAHNDQKALKNPACGGVVRSLRDVSFYRHYLMYWCS